MVHPSSHVRDHGVGILDASTTSGPKSSTIADWQKNTGNPVIPSNDDGSRRSFHRSPVDRVKGPASKGFAFVFGSNEHNGKSPSSIPRQTNSSHTSRRRSQDRFRRAFSRFYQRNYGVLLVLLAMIFGSGMAISTRLLETSGPHGKPMHPYQILFVRQSITSSCAFAYGFWDGTIPHFPLGPRSVRWLLVGRGFSGFLGVFGFYFSLLYLPLSEATVLTFLAPMLTCYVCSYLEPNQSFTRQQQLASFLSLIGVVFIAKPTSFFSPLTTAGAGDVPAESTNSTASTVIANSTMSQTDGIAATPQQHLLAVGIAMVGVVGATGAYTFIRKIGERAHPFISINYFAVWCTIVSLFFLAVLPDVSFRLPGNAIEWALLLAIGFFGFVMQYLMTAGLAYGGARVEGSDSESELVDRIESRHSAGDLDEHPNPHRPMTSTRTAYTSNITSPIPPEVSQERAHPSQSHHLTPNTPSISQLNFTLRQRSPSPNKNLLPTYIRPPQSTAINDPPSIRSPPLHTPTKVPSPPPASQTRATQMVYTQMLFALAGDKLVFGITPTAASWIGSALILVSAVWVASAADGVGGEKEGMGKAGTQTGKRRKREGATRLEDRGGIDEEEAEGLLDGGGDGGIDMVQMEQFDEETRQQRRGANSLLARQLSYTSV